MTPQTTGKVIYVFPKSHDFLSLSVLPVHSPCILPTISWFSFVNSSRQFSLKASNLSLLASDIVEVNWCGARLLDVNELLKWTYKAVRATHTLCHRRHTEERNTHECVVIEPVCRICAQCVVDPIWGVCRCWYALGVKVEKVRQRLFPQVQN